MTDIYKGRSRNWCITVNNFTDLPVISEHQKYLIYGKEIAPITLTPHLQGFVVYNNQVRLMTLKKDFPGCHAEIAKGTVDQNVTYCSKEADFVEQGVRPLSNMDKGVSEVQRWADALEAAKESRFDDIPADIYIRHRGTLLSIAAEHTKLQTLDHETKHLWYYGGPGTGKSLRARSEHPEAYIKDPNSVWWDGYTNQKVVIIDDFDKYQVKQGGDMKRWLDIYPFQAQVKGGQRMIRPELVIITSNYSPSEIWEDQVTQEAILRRIRVTHFN